LPAFSPRLATSVDEPARTTSIVVMMPRLFVGDVQGCADELDELLDRAHERFGDEFELWQVGDLVNRGPGNLRVLERVRSLADAGRALCVLGNHEISLLEVAFGLRSLRPEDTYGDVLESSDGDDWIEWIRRLPLVRSGTIARTPFVMVHAAAHPGWSLVKLERGAKRVARRLASDDLEDAVGLLTADPALDRDAAVLRRFTQCRSIPAKGEWSSAEPRTPSEAWHRVWAAEGHTYGVVYGHWARQRLHVARGLRGLDSGCVHHGRGSDGYLTGWLPKSARPGGEHAFAVPDDAFWKVRARRRYYTSPTDPPPVQPPG
jgi:bis(5'-nucleosyl)-tetraphosphatase (symmetrical)